MKHSQFMDNCLDQRDMVERRNHPRFEVQAGAFIRVNPDYSGLGLIKDISRGGLSFRYIESGRPPFKLSAFISISAVDAGVNVDRIPVKVISDLNLILIRLEVLQHSQFLEYEFAIFRIKTCQTGLIIFTKSCKQLIYSYFFSFLCDGILHAKNRFRKKLLDDKRLQ
jgi:hypothetical protein